MPITSLEIKDKTFGTRFRGFDPEEVDEFLDIVVRDYEDLVRANHDKDLRIKSLEERLSYFDEMKDSLSQSVLIAQDTAERVKQAAHERSNNIVHQAEQDVLVLLKHFYLLLQFVSLEVGVFAGHFHDENQHKKGHWCAGNSDEGQGHISRKHDKNQTNV